MAIMTHGECLEELWDLSRSYDRNRTDFISLAHYCMGLADSGVPCELRGITDYAAVKFTAAMWSDKVADTMAAVFEAYVKFGYIKVSEPLVANDDSPNSHYRKMAGQLPLVVCVRNGNIHSAEQFVIHGASTDISVDGKDFFSFVQAAYGTSSFTTPSLDERHGAAARLLEAAMGRHIGAAKSTPARPAPPRRRACI